METMQGQFVKVAIVSLASSARWYLERVLYGQSLEYGAEPGADEGVDCG